MFEHVIKGRKPHLTPEQANEAREMYRGPRLVRQIARADTKEMERADPAD